LSVTEAMLLFANRGLGKAPAMRLAVQIEFFDDNGGVPKGKIHPPYLASATAITPVFTAEAWKFPVTFGGGFHNPGTLRPAIGVQIERTGDAVKTHVGNFPP
jgi:hypothetical protein